MNINTYIPKGDTDPETAAGAVQHLLRFALEGDEPAVRLMSWGFVADDNLGPAAFAMLVGLVQRGLDGLGGTTKMLFRPMNDDGSPMGPGTPGYETAEYLRGLVENDERLTEEIYGRWAAELHEGGCTHGIEVRLATCFRVLAFAAVQVQQAAITKEGKATENGLGMYL